MEEATQLMHAPQRHRTLHDYFQILIKRRWLILLVFFAIVAYTALKTFTETPIYTATVQLLIERQTPHYIDQPGASAQSRLLRGRILSDPLQVAGKPGSGQKSGRKT